MKTIRTIMSTIASSTALPVALAANAGIAALTVVTFAPLQYGTLVRPMGWSLAVFAIAGVAFVAGIYFSLVDISRGKAKLGLIGVALSLVPAPLAIILFKLFIMLKALRVAD